MILDENMEMDIKVPFKVSSQGITGVEAKTLIFLPPQPRMAKDTSMLVRYFKQIQREVAEFTIKTQGLENIRGQAEAVLEAGNPVGALHEIYEDGSPEAREAILADINEAVDNFRQSIDVCTSVDDYQMTADFGMAMINNKRCMVSCGESKILLTRSIWENQVDFKERLEATIRYCCFFDLTSSMAR